MQISRVQNQPNFQANFSNDAVTQSVLRRVRRSAAETNFRDMTDSCLNIMGLLRKNQTVSLDVSNDGKLLARAGNFWQNLFGKGEHFENNIINNDISDAFVRICTKMFRGW